MDTSLAAVTVRVVVPVTIIPPWVRLALIVDVPAPSVVPVPVAAPMVPTAGLLELHTTELVTSPVIPLA
jgi:hypothetical protein